MEIDETFEEISSTAHIPIILRDNCSVYNPCGRNGNCRNNLDGEWTCVCKFWWNGTLCNKMTSSGEQVIIVGVLLFVLLLVFYGLQLFYYIRNRRKNPPKKAAKPDVSHSHRRLSTVSTMETHPISRRILSLVVFVGTLLLGAGTLIAKWRILQSIHDEIMDKYKNKQPLFFQRPYFCRVLDLRNDFNVITFPAACLLIIIFTITTKRMSFQRERGCRGYIGPPIPVDFFSHVRRTFAAVIFAIFADELLDIANHILRRDRASNSHGIMVSYLRQVFRVLVIGFRRYPTLAGIYIDTPFSLICATLYTLLDFSITIANTGFCLNDFYATDKTYNTTGNVTAIKYLAYYGAGSKLLFFQILNDIPRYVFLSYISVKLISLLFKRLRHRAKPGRQLSREQKTLLYSSLPHSVESRYVQNLLGLSDTKQPKSRLAKMFRFIYVWRDDFRFSARVVCVYAAVFLLLFFVTVQALVRVTPTLVGYRERLQQGVDMLVSLFLPQDPNLREEEDTSFNLRLPNLAVTFLLAILFTLIVTTIQLLTMLASIRRNLLQAFRGDHTEIPSPTSGNNAHYVAGNFRFAGTLIGYVILGYVFLGFFSLIGAVIIGTFIEYGSSGAIEFLLKFLIPLQLFIGFKMYLNRILAKYVFLQHRINILSLNNRRVFMIFLYFNIFLDAFLGVVAAVMRLLRSTFGGIVYMCRLDYSPLGRKLETKDTGFSAYCGFIYVECAHRHPVLLCFLSHLLRDQLYGGSHRRWSKARRKWALALLLLNNPTLIYQRKKFQNPSDQHQMKLALITRKYQNELGVVIPSAATYQPGMDSRMDLQTIRM